MVGGPSEVFASSRAAFFCAGMNPLSLKDLVAGCLTDARCLLSAHSMLDAGWLLAQYWLLARCWMLAECSLDAGACWGLVIAAKGYLESFSVNMFLRKRVLPRM